MASYELILDVIEVEQRVGTYYIASIKAEDLLKISYVDRMRMEKGEDARASYLGIQRKLDPSRVKKIAEYVKTRDASFPTSILLAITEDCAEIIETTSKSKQLKLSPLNADEINSRIKNEIINEFNKNDYLTEGIAKVLDGQHRIAGLSHAIRDLEGVSQLSLFEDETKEELIERLKNFELNVAIFIGYDIHEQAKLFGIVNLAQTKVNKSLVYNLEEYSKARSPQRVCHNIAKLLDESEKSPFFEKIKMLGCKTMGRIYIEPLTQSAFVETLMSTLSKNPELDRDILNRKHLFGQGKIDRYTDKEKERYIFRELFLNEEDGELLDIIWNYFEAVKYKWTQAWDDVSNSLLPKNNCFRALMRYLRDIYPLINKKKPLVDDFYKYFENFEMTNEDFNSSKGLFPRGEGGMSKFYKYLNGQITYQELQNN